MTSALIVEDEPLLRAELRDQLAQLWPELELAGEAGNGIEAVRLIEELRPDIVFLDIQMAGMSGLEVARHVPETSQVVFMTAYPEHALTAFDTGAIDYLVKPVTVARLATTLKRLRTRTAAARPAPVAVAAAPVYLKWIKASLADTVRLIMVDDVIVFQADGKYTRVVTAAGEALIRLPLKGLIDQLEPQRFAQIHRSTIVSLREIDRIERIDGGLTLRLKGRAERYTVSEAYMRQFRQM